MRTLLLPLLAAAVASAAEEEVQWRVEYRGNALPTNEWSAKGEGLSEVADGALHLTDNSAQPYYFEAQWLPEPGTEVIVEARVKVGTLTGSAKGKSPAALWPWRDGAAVMLQVCDGTHEEGLVVTPTQASSFTDRFIPMDTASRAHTYRLVIRGNDMSIAVDGAVKVVGQNAYWHPADGAKPFLRFGSSAKNAMGDAFWESVKLGVRKIAAKPTPAPVTITATEAWAIPRKDAHQTRPYLYDVGSGLLLTSVAQGSDAFYEPYAVLKSTDSGESWAPIPGLDQIDWSPLPLVRRKDGTILGASRWTWPQPDGSLTGVTTHLNADATAFTTEDSHISLPEQYMPAAKGDIVIFERHIWNDDDGGLTAVLWSRIAKPLPDGRKNTVRFSHLVRSMDQGKTWTYLATIGPGGEPAVARLSKTELTAVIRGERTAQMIQTFSHDGGRTWERPVALEVGKVAPDLVPMSNGVLACSYGRPASCLMFSLDGGKTWPAHYVISDRTGFNYCSIREISPGRLLFMHDAPTLSALYVDVVPAR